MSEEHRTHLRIEIAPRTIAYVLLAVAGVWLMLRLWSVALVVVVALVLVGTFDPVVAWLQRKGFGRGRALMLLFFGVAAVISAVMLLTVPPLLAQLQHIIEDAPAEKDHLVKMLHEYRWAGSIEKAVQSAPIDDVVLRAGNALISYSADIMVGIGYAITTLFLSIYLLADPDRAKSLLYAVVPRHHHVKLAKILLEMKTIVGGYMRGQLITSLAITLFTFALLTALRVDDALALAMFAGLTDVIPFVGGYIASAPAVLVVAPEGGAMMALVAFIMFLYQEFESRILVPRVYGRVLRLPPAIVVVALLAGGTLLGILGALLALPIAAGLQMLVRELRVELPGQVPHDAAMRARDSRASMIYERLAANEPVEKAAAIAGELAAKIKQSEKNGTRLSAEYEVPENPGKPK